MQHQVRVLAEGAPEIASREERRRSKHPFPVEHGVRDEALYLQVYHAETASMRFVSSSTGVTPIMVSAGSPPLNKIIVGIAVTVYLPATAGLSSTLHRAITA